MFSGKLFLKATTGGVGVLEGTPSSVQESHSPEVEASCGTTAWAWALAYVTYTLACEACSPDP